MEQLNNRVWKSEGTENQLKDSYMIVIIEWREQFVHVFVWGGVLTIYFCHEWKGNMRTYHIAAFWINIGCLDELRKLLFSVWSNYNRRYEKIGLTFIMVIIMVCIVFMHINKKVCHKYTSNSSSSTSRNLISSMPNVTGCVRECLCVWSVWCSQATYKPTYAWTVSRYFTRLSASQTLNLY